jgi:hypothetical protein
MAAPQRARLIALLQSARPMRLFRNCRFLSGHAVDEILALASAPGAADDESVAAVGEAIRRAKQAPLTDGRRVQISQIDELLSRLGA